MKSIKGGMNEGEDGLAGCPAHNRLRQQAKHFFFPFIPHSSTQRRRIDLLSAAPPLKRRGGLLLQLSFFCGRPAALLFLHQRLKKRERAARHQKNGAEGHALHFFFFLSGPSPIRKKRRNEAKPIL